MTPAQFLEIFRAAIRVEGRGNPTTWEASSPLVRALCSTDPQTEDRDAICFGTTPEEAISALVVRAVEVARKRVTEARAALNAAEERWRRIEAAAVEIGRAP